MSWSVSAPRMQFHYWWPCNQEQQSSSSSGSGVPPRNSARHHFPLTGTHPQHRLPPLLTRGSLTIIALRPAHPPAKGEGLSGCRGWCTTRITRTAFLPLEGGAVQKAAKTTSHNSGHTPHRSARKPVLPTRVYLPPKPELCDSADKARQQWPPAATSRGSRPFKRAAASSRGGGGAECSECYAAESGEASAPS